MPAPRFLPILLLPAPALLPALALLSACGGADAVHSAPALPAPSRLAPLSPLLRAQPGVLHIQNLPGLEGVIGAKAGQLTAQFGPPRLDVIEGDGRKLQFNGAACVLDIYLYSLAPGQEPQASYVDARRSDGRDVDRAACVAALRQTAR